MRGGREVAQLRRSEAECETRRFIFRALFYSSSITTNLKNTPLATLSLVARRDDTLTIWLSSAALNTPST
jgi:hypothetical protein